MRESLDRLEIVEDQPATSLAFHKEGALLEAMEQLKVMWSHQTMGRETHWKGAGDMTQSAGSLSMAEARCSIPSSHINQA